MDPVHEILFGKVINIIKKNRIVNTADARFILSQVKNIRPETIQGKSIDYVAEVVSKIIISDLSNVNIEPQIDVREYLKDSIGSPEATIEITSNDPNADVKIKDLIEKPKLVHSLFSPKSLYKKAYLRLDSRWRLRDTLTNNQFKWNLAYSGTQYDPTTSTVSTSRITSIIGMKIIPFKLPNTYNSIANGNRINIRVKEFDNQAYIGYNNQRYHFTLSIKKPNGYREADAAISVFNYEQAELNDLGNNFSEFNFAQPITQIDTLTLSFDNGFDVLTLDPDIITNVTLSYNVLTPTVTTFTFASIPYIALYDTIIISGITLVTGAESLQSQLDSLQRPEGWIITNQVSATVMQINFNFDDLDKGATDRTNMVVYLNSKRLMINLEITYIEQP